MKIMILLLILSSLTGCVDSARSDRDSFDFTPFFQDPVDETPPEPEINTRPNNAVRISNFCGCKGVKPVLSGTGCDNFCADKNGVDTETILYMDFIVDPAISLNTSLVDTAGWCKNAIPDNEAQQNAFCKMDVRSETGEFFTTLNFEVANINGNKANINISSLPDNKTFILKLVEGESSASSANSIQLRKKLIVTSQFDGLPPVSIDPLNMYTCMINLNRSVNNDGSTNYVSVTREYFYESEKIPFAPLPIGTKELYCFDFILENTTNDNDNINYDRIEMTTGVFSLWDRSDIRFKDNWSWKESGSPTTNGKEDIIDLIEYEVYKLTFNNNLDLTGIFNKLKGFDAPSDVINSGDNSQTANNELNYGYFLSPISKDQLTTYCPTNADYYATVNANPVDRALGVLLGVETQALYVAEKLQAENYIDTNGQPTQLRVQQMYITRSTLDEISYYYNDDQVREVPTQSQMDNKTIYFHWPPYHQTGTTRFVKTEDQKVYKILKPEPEGTTGIVPKDGKLGCVPKQ